MGQSIRKAKVYLHEESTEDVDHANKFELQTPLDPVIVGVCVMSNKVSSNPMRNLLSRLQNFHAADGSPEFHIVIFDENTIFNVDIEQWPVCEVLIAFFSTGYPLKKVQRYIQLRRPFCVNDIMKQDLLLDRRDMYSLLEESGVPTPPHVVVSRDGWRNSPIPIVKEYEDYIVVNGVTVRKPFVEKPVDGEDHNIHIYYALKDGGGCQKLFRKVGNQSSLYCADESALRKDGSFIYEEFLRTEGTDIKIYTVGEDYTHAEARKSPVVDGVVLRKKDGKELRYPIALSPFEKLIARRCSVSFGQRVCGLDLLRAEGRSYVCDVNGWSFVKGNEKYDMDAAMIFRQMFLTSVGRNSAKPAYLVSSASNSLNLSRLASESTPVADGSYPQRPILRCVVGVIRHGDRTPKQKSKLLSKNPVYLAYFDGEVDKQKEIKLKSPKELRNFLNITRNLVVEYNRLRSEGSLDDCQISSSDFEKLDQIRIVLEKGGEFEGINRKVQLKPVAWEPLQSNDDDFIGVMEGVDNETSLSTPVGKCEVKVSEVLVILKWGGELTHSGHAQAMTLGKYFRANLYGRDPSIRKLSLHSMSNHDLKVFSSDEGRVQLTAAAFLKSFLDLDGHLPPILVSLVRLDNHALSGSGTQKTRLVDFVNSSIDFSESAGQDTQIQELLDSLHVNIPISTLRRLGIGCIGNPRVVMDRIYEMLLNLTAGMKCCLTQKSLATMSVSPSTSRTSSSQDHLDSGIISDEGELCHGETPYLIYDRWAKLVKDLYNLKTKVYDVSKIPDCYDCIRYDILHNAEADIFNEADSQMREAIGVLHDDIKLMADFVIPQEFGVTTDDKVAESSTLCKNLISRILRTMMEVTHLDDPYIDFSPDSPSPNRRSIQIFASAVKKTIRTRLFFTSESHLHSLLNVLCLWLIRRLRGKNAQPDDSAVLSSLWDGKISELSYMSHIVFKMYEYCELQHDDPNRFVVDLLFSPGCDGDPRDDHIAPHTPGIRKMRSLLSKPIPLIDFVALFSDICDVDSIVKNCANLVETVEFPHGPLRKNSSESPVDDNSDHEE